jgi:hypothetical protein
MRSRFDDDPEDKKIRFLRGLNWILGNSPIEDKNTPFESAITRPIFQVRNRLAELYCLEFTEDEILEMECGGMTTGEFTEIYCPIIYQERGTMDFHALVADSRRSSYQNHGTLAIDFSRMDSSPKFGINGREWCDVAEGPCSCGSWHR